MRYLMLFSYDGSLFSGYQKQNKKRTVEEEIEKVLTKLNHEKKVKIYASGRTDAKVHALGQVAHFNFEQIDVENLKYKLNKLLPKDIYVENIKEVSENFHARYDLKKKTYLYKINCGKYNPFDFNYIYQYNKSLNIEKIKEACRYFIGEHDFTSFTKASGKKENMLRTIYNIDINYKNDILYLEFTGNGFLQYMVRNIVGFLIEVGEEKRNPCEVEEILNKKNRKYASFTASPVGLYLKSIEY
jgi:tRNA pseudouridine38-40 synthase